MSDAPKTRRIAGHEFDLRGVCVIGDCRKRLAEILGATQADVGQPGWAHTGNLNGDELSQIVAERDRIWSAHLGGSA